VAVGPEPGSVSRALRGHRHLGRHPHEQRRPRRYHCSADPGTSTARSRCRSAGVATEVVTRVRCDRCVNGAAAHAAAAGKREGKPEGKREGKRL